MKRLRLTIWLDASKNVLQASLDVLDGGDVVATLVGALGPFEDLAAVVNDLYSRYEALPEQQVIPGL